MKKKALNWAVLCLIWEAKGYSMKQMPDRLRAAFPGRVGLSFTSINRKVHSSSEAPDDVAAFVMDEKKLPTRKGREEYVGVVRLGVAALQDSAVADPEALAATIAAKVPTLDPEVIARAVASKKLRFPVARLVRKVTDALRDKLETVEAKLDKADARRESDKQEILRAVRATGGMNGLVTLFAVLLLGGGALYYRSLAVGDSSRQVTRAAEFTPPQVIIVTNVAQGGAPVAFDLRTFLAAIETGQMGGKTPEENWIPSGPLPGQKVPPCDARLGESAINGGCWGNMGDVKPPCGLLFRGGDKCYRPIAADPTKPVGEPQQRLSQEVR